MIVRYFYELLSFGVFYDKNECIKNIFFLFFFFLFYSTEYSIVEKYAKSVGYEHDWWFRDLERSMPKIACSWIIEQWIENDGVPYAGQKKKKKKRKKKKKKKEGTDLKVWNEYTIKLAQ